MSDNPFRIDPIIRLMMEEADVDSLKTLREMDGLWNYSGVKELEKRASKLQLKPADFSCGEDKEDFESFLEDTKSNSQLFQSFKFFYPECLKFFDFYFLSDYTPKYIGLKIDEAFKFTLRDIKYLHNFFKMCGPELQELEIEVFKLSDDSSTDEEGDEASLSFPAKCGKQLIFPNLTKFSLKNHRACGADNSELIGLFKFILDKSVAVDPAANLINLEIDSIIYNLYDAIGLDPLTPSALNRWTRLTRLSIHVHESSEVQFTSTLLALGEAGMSLEHLDMPIHGPCVMERPNLSLISTNYSRFFHTQSESLKILIFRCNFEQMGDANEEELIKAKIRLPVFENVHTFKLKIIMCGVSPLAYRIFELGPFPVHFPKLETLKTFNQEVLSIMFPEDSIPEPIPLRFLKIWIWSDEKYCEGWKDAFGDKIRSVEHFKCQGMIFDDEQEKEIPWVESLKVMEIYEVKSLLRIGYLKNLHELTVIERCLPRPKRYLRYFDQVRSLNLSAITFKFKWGELSKKDKTKIINFFPFTVNFTKI